MLSKMIDEINPKIIEKIKKIKEDDIREFLKEIMHLEFQNIEEGRWMFRESYDKSIKLHLKNT